ncbi:MAG: protein kinase [Pirellulaceae bacterium]
MNIDIEEQLDDLLVQWELSREEGRELTASELCQNQKEADQPGLMQELQRRIGLLQASSWMLLDQGSFVSQTENEQNKNERNTISERPDVTVESFVNALSDSGVLTSQQLDVVAQYASKHKAADAETLAQQLVQENLLTDYQARVLLDGAKSPLLLDRYIVLDAIGSGGMGLVFKGFHRSMERVVAIKVLPQHAVDSPDKVLRFQREVKSAAKLSHPNIVAAYDAHERNGTYFLVMEYVDGENLLQHVAQHGPMSIDDAVRVVDQVAAALGAAHEKKMVHRDVKPTNIMLTSDGTAKLLDLGLARIMAHSIQIAAGQRDLTQDGLAMGTASYMSPEQALDATQADERSDIYSLGCTLYFLLSGRPPFQRNTTVQTIVAHREVAAPRLSDAIEDVPPALENCYQRMVAKSPGDRFSSIDELREALTGGRTLQPVFNAVTPAARVSRDTKAPSLRFPRWAWATAIACCVLPLLLWIVMSSLSKSDPSLIHRNVAKWALINGGIVDIETDLGDQEIYEVAELPEGKLRVVGLDLYEASDDFSLDPIFDIEGLRYLTLNEFAKIPHKELCQIDSLETLTLLGCDVSGNDLQCLSRMRKLTDLTIAECAVSDESLAFLGEIESLKLLDLAGTDVTDDGLKSLGKLKQLESLDLSRTLVTGSGLKHLAPQLTTLLLESCDIGDETVPQLQRMTALQALDLGKTQLTSKGAEQLSTMTSLTYLDLGGISLSADVLRQFAKLPDLAFLGLSRQKLSDQHLDAILEMKQIEDLDLSRTNLNDEKVMRLLDLKKLIAVGIDRTRVSDSAIDRIYSKRPSLSFYYEDGEF